MQTQVGSGTDDGNYRHSRDVMGKLLDFGQADYTDHNPNVWFAHLHSDHPTQDNFIWYVLWI